jgi:hypothetical protein
LLKNIILYSLHIFCGFLYNLNFLEKKKKSNFYIQLKYISNFKPNYKRLLKKKTFNRSFVYAKSFFFFIFFCNFIKITTINCFEKVVFFVQPQYSPLFTLLRAPYRYKISRDQITFNRYFINFFFYLNESLNNINFNNFLEIFIFLNVYVELFSVFETNFFFKKKIKISFVFFLKNFFIVF